MMYTKASDIKKLGDGRHSFGQNIFLFIRGGSKIWQYRYQIDGKRRDMTLGSYPEMSLTQAREARNDAHKLARQGIDPREARTTRIATVSEIIETTFEAIKGDLKGEGVNGRWLSPLQVHIIPKLGDRDITTIDAITLRDTLAPIWRTKTSASEKALQRMKIVLRHAAAQYPGKIDMSVIDNAKVLLGSQAHKPTHISAMPWQEVPAFYASLGRGSVDLALRLLILTASRSTPIRKARVDEFDDDTWNIPAFNMKSSEPFRVPLSDEAQNVIDYARPMARGGYLFVGPRGKPISDMAMTALLRRRDLEYRPHGFRSTFRDWCADNEKSWELAETSLDHRVGGKVQRAYQRSDLLDARRPLMQEWAHFVTSST